MKQKRKIVLPGVRRRDSHKGTFGRALIIGGSAGMSGAPSLAGRAALRSGSGLVRAAVPQSILPIVASLEPCYTTLALPEDGEGRMAASSAALLMRAAEEHDVVCFGPGAGTGPGVREALLALIGCAGLRLMIDADGLNVLAGSGNWVSLKKASVVLTPHPGEFGRLWRGLTREAMADSREAQAASLAERIGGVVVLKGAGSVVAEAGGQVYVNTTGNPGMATAGSGDVLSGMITALAGQGMSDFDAAVLAVYVHGKAGDLAAEEKGQISMTATDLIDYLPAAFVSAGEEIGQRED